MIDDKYCGFVEEGNVIKQALHMDDDVDDDNDDDDDYDDDEMVSSNRLKGMIIHSI